MADLTVLVSPMPLYPLTTGFSFGRPRPTSKPVMVTLDSSEAGEKDQDQELEMTPTGDADPSFPFPSSPSSSREGMASPPRRSRSPRTTTTIDATLLSPPVNTWKAPQERERIRSRHRPTRSRSAPPERRYMREEENAADTDREKVHPFFELPLTPTMAQEAPASMRLPKRSFTAGGNGHTRGGELLPPPPPLLRPTTFWRKTRRSGVSGASYSPSSHLIRRSTYIAAGLAFDSPIHDLSALCVESRVGFIVVPPDQKFEEGKRMM